MIYYLKTCKNTDIQESVANSHQLQQHELESRTHVGVVSKWGGANEDNGEIRKAEK